MSKARTNFSRRVFLSGTSAAIVAGVAPIRAGFAQAAAIKVGVMLPTSGAQAQIGQACMRGAQAGAAMLKDLGYPALELMAGDTETNPDIGRAAAERLINAGAQILTGAFDSGQTAAIAQVAEQRGIPFVINIAAAPQITEQGYKFVFRNFIRAPEIVMQSFELQKQLFAASGKTPAKVVCMHVNDTYGTAIKGAIDALFPRMGMPYQFADFIAYDPQARDLSVEVAKAKASGGEMVLMVSRVNDAILITREMVKQRWEPAGIVSAGPGWYEGAYMKALGKIGNYPISTVPWYDPRKPLSQKMVETHLKMFPGQVIDTNTCYTVEALLAIADAFKRSRNTAPQAMAEALRATNISANDSITLNDGVKFDAKGQNNGMRMAAVQNFDGEARVVLPLASAERNLVHPMPSWQGRK